METYPTSITDPTAATSPTSAIQYPSQAPLTVGTPPTATTQQSEIEEFRNQITYLNSEFMSMDAAYYAIVSFIQSQNLNMHTNSHIHKKTKLKKLYCAFSKEISQVEN